MPRNIRLAKQIQLFFRSWSLLRLLNFCCVFWENRLFGIRLSHWQLISFMKQSIIVWSAVKFAGLLQNHWNKLWWGFCYNLSDSHEPSKKRKVAKAVDTFFLGILMLYIFIIQFDAGKCGDFMKLSSWSSFCFLAISWLIELNPYEWSQFANIKRGTLSLIVHFRLYSLMHKCEHDLFFTLIDVPILTQNRCELKKYTFMRFLF